MEERPTSKIFVTAVLALCLVGLHVSLREQQAEETLGHNSSNRQNRKLLQYNTSMYSNQRASSKPRHELQHARTEDCSKLRNLSNSEERCHFIKSTESCQMDDGFIQYLQIPYCSFHGPVALAFFFLSLWLVFLFIILGLTADDYFCPSLMVISKTLRISENIAGVTFLAYGNGAPDIFSALAALSHAKSSSAVQLGMQALFGAGMFVTTVVVGVISFVSTVTLASRPFTRDVLFYLGAMSWVFITLYKENITVGEAIGFIVFYVAYVLLVIVGRFIYQRWKRKIAAIDRFLESGDHVGVRHMRDTAGESSESLIVPGNTNSVSCDVSPEQSMSGENLDHTLSDAMFATENTLFAPAIHHIPKQERMSILSCPKPANRRNSFDASDERSPLLARKQKISEWRKFLQGLEPFDREEWNQSGNLWRVFIVFKVPAVFFLNLTIPVVDYDKKDHNWNKWLNVLQCLTMPVFAVVATKVSGVMIGGRFPVWALALCGGLLLAVIVAMTTRSDRRPSGHFLFAYLAFMVSVIWIYTTANEIVNLLQTFGIVSGMSNAILGLTFLAWGNSIGDLVSNTTMARQGFSRMGVSACFGGPLLNMLLGIGISCTYLTISREHAIPLRHNYNQYIISAGFLATSLSSSAIVIPLMGFKVPRMYGVYLILLYIAYLTTSIVAQIKHF